MHRLRARRRASSTAPPIGRGCLDALPAEATSSCRAGRIDGRGHVLWMPCRRTHGPIWPRSRSFGVADRHHLHRARPRRRRSSSGTRSTPAGLDTGADHGPGRIAHKASPKKSTSHDTRLADEGLRLMAIGMGIVLAFLLLLVGVLRAMSAAAMRFAPEPGWRSGCTGRRGCNRFRAGRRDQAADRPLPSVVKPDLGYRRPCIGRLRIAIKHKEIATNPPTSDHP